MGFADLHIHTMDSYDGTASVSAVLQHAKEIGLDIIAITDHDEIRGSLKALELVPSYDAGPHRSHPGGSNQHTQKESGVASYIASTFLRLGNTA